ncbi:MAG: DUF3443 domain-containing protein [Thiomonas sp.]|uniref:DUF3443 domain-containing protein n=1 Tax=Thiomonas sp. TaxID=2047785 RepID=UPI002A3722CB|nr:DUF3443 domain-containing protein [Thiomonas sp.]
MSDTSRLPRFRRLLTPVALGTALLLSACGGGGSTPSTTADPAPPPAASAPSTPPAPPAAPNVAAISIRQLGSNTTTLTANTPYVTVTVCAPDGSACQAIPDVLVDTGSAGLRLFSKAVSSATFNALPKIASGSGELAACAQFASGYAWGGMRQSLVRIGGMTTTAAVPIQIMDDPTLPAAPSACTSQGGSDFASSFYGIANGILGISNFRYDCGSACASSTFPGVYYACSSTSCTPATASTSQQGINPIAAFASDNNGSILALPGVPLPDGAPSANGTLTFGIDTQANNTLSTAQIYPLDRQGNLKMTLNGTALSGFVDSGSNGYYLALSGVPTCSQAAGFYCPSQAFSLAASLQLADKSYGPAQTLTIGNAQAMFATQNAALPALGGTAAITGFVDLGLPFFYSRTIATGLEGSSTSTPYGYLAY